MLTLHSWPQAILHLDADAFFASVEQALHPEYRNKPVITGKERNIVACSSYEAKRRGVVRAMPIHEALRLCPDAIVLPSDYETYSLFSARMFTIMRQFTPMVEEYSIDEGFAHLTGLRRMYKTSYEGIARQIKERIEKELGITVSIGLSLSKSLAKLASKRQKPAGFTPVSGRTMHTLLIDTPLEKVWGFGPNTTALLQKMNLWTAYDFIQKPKSFAKNLLGKIGDELWRELSGEVVYPVSTAAKVKYQSISKTKTFTPASSDKAMVYSQLVRNLESACIKARRYNLTALSVFLFMRLDTFDDVRGEIRLSRPSNHPLELLPFVRKQFDALFEGGKRYRATGVVLGKLQAVTSMQTTLFEDPVRMIHIEAIDSAIDHINASFGKHTVSVASSWLVHRYKRHQGSRGDIPFRQRLDYPLFSAAV